MNFKKKIPAFIFLLIAVLPVVALTVQQVQISVWKQEAFERFEKQNAIIVTVNAAQLKWERKNKEAIINGNLFDVKKLSKIANGDYILTGIFDKHEDYLKETFTKNLAGQSSKQNTVTQNFFSFLYFENNQTGQMHMVPSAETSSLTALANIFIPHYLNDIFIPPPNC